MAGHDGFASTSGHETTAPGQESLPRAAVVLPVARPSLAIPARHLRLIPVPSSPCDYRFVRKTALRLSTDTFTVPGEGRP